MRKRPQQQRAKMIVESILEGAQQCISEYGVLQVTTPKIAEKSGVSVGSIYQYFENKEQIIAELLLRKSENLGQAIKQLVTLQQQSAIQDIITLSIAFGFESLKSDQGFFIEILKNWHAYSDSEAAQVLEQHFLEVGMYLFGRYYPHWDFETLKHKSFVIINSTLFTMMRYASKNTFLIEEQRLQQELSKMIVSFLDAV
ncbi:TetR/AcrR family transcriptional regulator [Acinetobacter calcoaceticus]|uniref:TetR/AcrR family transcriptional regulator n=1 Tax=Acinetobacter TaxID=469 RepID=UPI0019028743|nr:TetR/AcrR family transcriptional regulator [Acinetobacter courvalinii]MBJ9958254.1 TetR/AcrR family transcriptional regulator [Acinetobacter courvalinii]WPE81258.1 TetR/AcrR family transcriptional regulator [Acinetobacter baumannii]